MKRLSIILLPIFLGSCSLLTRVDDDPVRHLLEAEVPSRSENSSKPVVAVARPMIPPYLERPEFVTRTENGTLKIHDNNLWAESLDAGISRVVADNLRRLKGSTNIQPAANFITRDYSSLVEIRIERFDPLPDGNLILECTWLVQPIGGGDAAPKTFRTTVPVVESKVPEINTGMRGRVVAMNEALARLSRAIAKAL